MKWFFKYNQQNLSNRQTLEVILIKNCKIKPKIFHFSPTNFWIWNRVYSDKSKLDSYDEIIRIQNLHFSWKLSWKNCWNCYVVEKRIVSKLSRISIHFNRTNGKLVWRLCENFMSLIFKFPRNRPSKSFMVGPGRAGSSFYMIQLVLTWSWKCISIFSDYFKGFTVVWMSSRRFIWLLIGTSLTRNDVLMISKINGIFRHNYRAIYDFTATWFSSYFLLTTMILVTMIPFI